MCVFDMKTKEKISDCGRCDCTSSTQSGNHEWITAIPESKVEYCSKCYQAK